MEADNFLADDRYDCKLEEISSEYWRLRVSFYCKLLIDSIREVVDIIRDKYKPAKPLEIECFGKFTDYTPFADKAEQISHYFYVDIWDLTAYSLKHLNPNWLPYFPKQSLLMRLLRKKIDCIYRIKIEIKSIDDYAFFDLTENLARRSKKTGGYDDIIVSSHYRIAQFPLSVLDNVENIEALQSKIQSEIRRVFLKN